MEKELHIPDWINNQIEFEENEEILSLAVFHKNPNVAQVLIWRAMSFGLTAKYFLLLTNMRVIVIPMNNEISFKRNEIMTLPFKKIRIRKEDGALDVNIGKKKPLRLYPDTFGNKMNHVNMNDFIGIIRYSQKMIDQ